MRDTLIVFQRAVTEFPAMSIGRCCAFLTDSAKGNHAKKFGVRIRSRAISAGQRKECMDERTIQRARQEAWKQVQQEYKDDPECCFAFGFEAGYRFAVAPRVEPPVTESGEGFESLPAEPSKQPEALRLADALEVDKWHITGVTAQQAADELRRLHELNQELVDALILLEREMVESGNATSRDYGWKLAIEKTRAAITKATGGAA